jgi:polar amino acid transport system substrate-binding protein
MSELAPDRRVADLVRSGRVRVALFPPQYTKDPVNGELKGIWADLARAFAARLGIEITLIETANPARMLECLGAGACDAAFLGFDPTRAAEVEGFSPPFIEVDYTYLVPEHSSIRDAADADRPGVRIAVVAGHASTLTLARLRRHAELVDRETPESAFVLLQAGRADAWASIRPALLDYSTRLPGSRVLPDRFGANLPAMVVAKGKVEWLEYVHEFIEDAKASGLVQRAVERAGARGVRVV